MRKGLNFRLCHFRVGISEDQFVACIRMRNVEHQVILYYSGFTNNKIHNTFGCFIIVILLYSELLYSTLQ